MTHTHTHTHTHCLKLYVQVLNTSRVGRKHDLEMVNRFWIAVVSSNSCSKNLQRYVFFLPSCKSHDRGGLVFI